MQIKEENIPWKKRWFLQYGTELLLDSVIKIILYLVLGGHIRKNKGNSFLHCLHGVLYENKQEEDMLKIILYVL